RRRHTSFSRDWSSDVCSSDLGTPSLFSGDAIARLLDGVRARLPLAPDAEITLEANPGAVEAARFAAYREAGVNRLSIGIQSFRRSEERRVGRGGRSRGVRSSG